MNSPKSKERLFSLYEAAWHFAPRTMKTAAIRERAAPVPRIHLERFESLDKTTIVQLEELHHTSMTLVRSMRDPGEPTPEMKARLIRALLNASFRAYGIKTIPKVGSRLQEIPFFIFEGRPKINWSKNQIENVGHRFEAVKVKRLSTTRQQRPIDRRRGRPTAVPDIIRAIKLASRANDNFLHMSRELQCREIQKQLISIDTEKYSKTYPSHRTIKKIIPKGLLGLKT
jgi:hypothetical protein